MDTNHFVEDNMDYEETKTKIDKKIGKFFLACSIPFKVVQNKYFLDLIQTLSQIKIVYKPPCRRTLATTVILSVYNDVIEHKKKILRGTYSVLLLDGWKNKSNNKKYLVFTLRNIHVTQIFLSFCNISTESEDGENVSEHINDAIRFAKEVYDTNVFAIITDNDAKVVRAGRLAVTIENEELLQCTCSSHSANLLIGSIVDDSFLAKVREIINAFKDPKLEDYILKRGGTILVNFPDTRFCYARDSFESVLKNLAILKEVCMLDDVFLNERIIDSLFDMQFKETLKLNWQILNPICKLINKCQDPLVNVADATQLWLSLKLPTDQYNNLIKNRIAKALKSLSFAANRLHHKYRGQLQNEEQRNIGNKFIMDKLNLRGKTEFEKYKTTIDNYEAFAAKCDSPIIYWNHLMFEFPTLSEFAKKLMLIPASTALIEGYFSNWKYVHSVIRNRLGVLKSAMLADTYYTLNQMDNTKEKKCKKKHLQDIP